MSRVDARSLAAARDDGEPSLSRLDTGGRRRGRIVSPSHRVGIAAVLLLALVGGTAAQAQDTLIPAGATWRFLDNGSNQGTAWRAPGFNDSSWDAGPAELGYGDLDESTLISFGLNPLNKHITTYFRITFSVPDPTAYTTAILRLLRDDGAVVYLNGNELLRSNMPAGTITSSTRASSEVIGSDESELMVSTFDPSLLVSGTNTLAVEVHISDPLLNTDLSFDLMLEATDHLDVCYAVADGASGDASADTLLTIEPLTLRTSALGNTGTTAIGAIAMELGGTTLYAAEDDRLGTLDQTTGTFTPRPNTFGSGLGALGPVVFDAVEGLTFDVTTGRLFGVVRRPGLGLADVLIEIDPVSGSHVPGAFGLVLDYVPILGVSLLFDNVLDIASDPVTGFLYGIDGDGLLGGGLVIIDPLTGLSVRIGSFGVNGMEGLAFDIEGRLYGSTGAAGPLPNRLFRIDQGTGAATLVGPFFGGVDTAALDCMSRAIPLDYGDAPAPPYPTVAAENGGRHGIIAGSFLGGEIDAEPDAVTDANATGDDFDGVDDEDGVSFIAPVAICLATLLEVSASEPGFLEAWIDADGDGRWEHPLENVLLSVPLLAGVNSVPLVVPCLMAPQPTLNFRFRYGRHPGMRPYGAVLGGEVEDYQVAVLEVDYGDAPDPTFPTLLASNGARHLTLPGMQLGINADGEVDGQPTAGADGDDTDGNNDDDGVHFAALPLIADDPVAGVTVTATLPGLLDAWIDFNGDGDWADAGERIFAGRPLFLGDNALTFPVPATAVAGTVIGRFRYSTLGSITWTGLALDGEVEDYAITLADDAQVSGFVWEDLDEDGIQDAGEAGRAGIEVEVYDDLGNLRRTVTTDASGNYLITGLRAGTYQVSVTAPVGLVFSPPNQGGDDALDSDADPLTGRTPLFTLATGQILGDLDAGLFEYPLAPPLCYGVADGIGNQATEDVLARLDPVSGTTTVIGPTGTFDIEAMAIDLDGSVAYAVDGGQLGRIDLATGTFTPLPQPIGSGIGLLGPMTFDDVDGLTFDVHRGVLFGAVRRDGLGLFDLLIQIDPVTGAHVSGAFGLGIDYVPITGATLLFDQIDDIASDPITGVLYGVANGGLIGGELVIIDTYTGLTLPVGLLGVDDVEGLAFFNSGELFATTGADGLGADRFYRVHRAGGTAVSLFPLTSGTDYEALGCLTAPVDLDYGDAPASYGVLRADNGARHGLQADYFLGGRIDLDADGQPDAGANGDDLDGIDDEDGFDLDNTVPLVICNISLLQVDVARPGFLDAWIDINGDGIWSHPQEQMLLSVALFVGRNDVTLSIPCSLAPLARTFARFRFGPSGGMTPYGAVLGGEVEDYEVTILGRDYGDAPGPYPTLEADDGARHIHLPGFYLGAGADVELDGLPSPLADGDDLDDGDDEDGVFFEGGPLAPGDPAYPVRVTASLPGLLDAWIDFNRDGDWDDAGEQIFASAVLQSGANGIGFPVPVSAVTGTTYARFRFSTFGGLTYEGLAIDGEVEDYQVTIAVPQVDSDGDGSPDDDEGTGDRDGDGVPNHLDYNPTGYFYDSADGAIVAGGGVMVNGPGPVTLIEDGSDGYFQFTVTTAGIYTLKVTPPFGYKLSTACPPRDPPPFDPTGGPDPTVLGFGEFGMTGFLASNACTPYYLTFDLAAGDPVIFHNNIPLEAVDLCYAVADSDKLSSSDELIAVDPLQGTSVALGSLGTLDVEAAALSPDGMVLYAANGGQLGTVDLLSGAFTATASPFGTAVGAAGSVALSDVDGLSFDPLTGILYGVHRTVGTDTPDLLFQIDPATGAHRVDAFGAGQSYVEIPVLLGLESIDDIAVDPTDGQMYAIANDDATGYNDRLVRLDKASGAISDVGVLGAIDMEGLAFRNDGSLYGSTGADGSFAGRDSLYAIDKVTGAATEVGDLLTAFEDYESLACLSGGASVLSGTVFRDEDVDGFYDDPPEPGQGGAVVRLYADLDGDGQVSAGDPLLQTTTSAAEGSYAFTIAAMGAFVVAIDPATLPAGSTLTTPAALAVEVIMAGQMTAGLNFGFALPAAVSGEVWEDLDADGVREAGEPGYRSVAVDLLDDGGTVLDTMTTGADGTYAFGGLASGTYQVRFTPPADAFFSPAGQGGDDTVDSDADPLNGLSPPFTVTLGMNVDGPDAALFRQAALGDFVWEDLDGNGRQDAEDPGIGGVAVALVDAMGTVVGSTTTAADGSYAIPGLRPGDYALRVTPPAGYVFTQPNVGADTADSDVDPDTGESALVSLISGAADNDLDAGLYRTTTVQGEVWEDLNGDGLRDDFEPAAAGVTVELHAADGTLLATAVSGADGTYVFAGRAPGDYFVTFIPPSGFSFSPQNIGGDDTVDSDADPATGETAGFQVLSAEVLMDIDAGLVPPPTEAVVSAFRVYDDRGKALVGWQTSSEVGTLGFYLLRRADDGRFERVNEALLPSVDDGAAGGTYYLHDPGAATRGTATYLLAEVESRGRVLFHGPFRDETEARPTSPVNLDAPFSRLRNELPAAARARLAARRAERADALRGRDERVGGAMKIAVEEAGLYTLSAVDIAARLDLATDAVVRRITAGQLSLTQRGIQVAWQAEPGGAGLSFYGEGIDSLYTRQNVYWLRPGAGLTMATVNGKAPAPAAAGQTFTADVHQEEDRLAVTHLASDPEADYWRWALVRSGHPSLGRVSFTVPTLGASGGFGTAQLSINLEGASASGAVDEHRARIVINGTVISELRWQGLGLRTFALDVPAELLLAGENEVEVRGILAAGVPFSFFYVDAFDLAYERTYQQAGDTFAFAAGGHEVLTLDGYAGPEVRIFEISDPRRPRAVTGVDTRLDSTGWSHSFAPATANGRYLAVTPAGVRAPAAVWSDVPSSLLSPDNIADYVVITSAALVEAGGELAALRQSQGFATLVVDIEDIMDELSFGIFDPKAIRAFLTHAHHGWRQPPRYVVLAGAGSFDYRDLGGLGDNVVPPLMVGTPDGLFAADGRYGDVVGDDGLPELAIGRLPVLTAAELSATTLKLASADADGAAWRRRAVLLADRGDAAGDFPQDADGLAGLLPADVGAERIYLSELPLTTARQRLFDALGAGTGWVVYLGHGGLDRMADEGLLKTEDVALLGNGQLPLVAGLTCAINRFAVPGFLSLGEALVVQPDGGAAAVLAPTGLSAHHEAVMLGAGYLRSALYNGGSLGDAVLAALAALEAQGGSRHMLSIYNLLGDPATRLPVGPR